MGVRAVCWYNLRTRSYSIPYLGRQRGCGRKRQRRKEKKSPSPGCSRLARPPPPFHLLTRIAAREISVALPSYCESTLSLSLLLFLFTLPPSLSLSSPPLIWPRPLSLIPSFLTTSTHSSGNKPPETPPSSSTSRTRSSAPIIISISLFSLLTASQTSPSTPSAAEADPSPAPCPTQVEEATTSTNSRISPLEAQSVRLSFSSPSPSIYPSTTQ